MQRKLKESWRDVKCPIFMDMSLNYWVFKCYLDKAMYPPTHLTYKVKLAFFFNSQKLHDCKMHMKMLRPTPKHNQPCWRLPFPSVKTYYRATVIKTMWCYHTYRYVGHRMCESSFMLFTLMPDNLTEERIVFLIKGVGITRYSHARISGVFVSYHTQKIIKRSK